MRRKTTAEFIEELNKVNPNIKVLGEYVTTHTKILCKCKVCGNEWESEAGSLLRGCGCHKCSAKKLVKQEENPTMILLENYMKLTLT